MILLRTVLLYIVAPLLIVCIVLSASMTYVAIKCGTALRLPQGMLLLMCAPTALTLGFTYGLYERINRKK